MPTTAGQMILAGDLARSLRTFERAGRGAAGYAAVDAMLRERHPGATTGSINAMLDRVGEVVSVGNRYRQANPTWAPDANTLPDVRRLESPYVLPSAPTQYFHEGLIEITDPNRGGAIIQTSGYTIPLDSILTREEFYQRLFRHAQSFLNTFINYNRPGLEKADMEITFRIEGVFRGY